MRRLCSMAVLVLSLGGSIGCGDSSSSSGGLSEADACKQLASALCDYMNRCGGTTALSMLGYASVAECKTSMQADCTSSPACDTGQTYHGDKAKECIDGFAGLSCTTTTTTPAACDQVCQ